MFRAAIRSKHLTLPFEISETIKIYTLLQIGLTYQDLDVISASEADKLLLLYEQIKLYEEDETKKMENKSQSRR